MTLRQRVYIISLSSSTAVMESLHGWLETNCKMKPRYLNQDPGTEQNRALDAKQEKLFHSTDYTTLTALERKGERDGSVISYLQLILCFVFWLKQKSCSSHLADWPVLVTRQWTVSGLHFTGRRLQPSQADRSKHISFWLLSVTSSHHLPLPPCHTVS